jgi:hypothetical protein
MGLWLELLFVDISCPTVPLCDRVILRESCTGFGNLSIFDVYGEFFTASPTDTECPRVPKGCMEGCMVSAYCTNMELVWLTGSILA